MKPIIPRNALMIDIETFGLRANAKILSIAGLMFDPLGKKEDLVKGDMILAPQFSVVLTLEDQEHRLEDPETVKWWSKQSEAARRPIFGPGVVKTPYMEALSLFDDWVGRQKPDSVYACAPNFDCIILEDAMESDLGRPFPVRFFNWHDVRSIRSFTFGKDVDQFNWGTKHEAMGDCVRQALTMQAAYSWRNNVTN